jgi:hypothetical protein
MNSDTESSGAPPPLPELRQAELDRETVEALFADLAALARIHQVIPKAGARKKVGEGAISLEQGRESFLNGDLRGLQIRYTHAGEEWWDVLLQPQPGMYRVTRMRLSDAFGGENS